MIWLAILSFLAAVLPALLYFSNIRQFRPPPPVLAGAIPTVSVLIPARNEEGSIASCVQHALANTHVDLEVIVLDDQSTDATAEIVRQIGVTDSRVRMETAPLLPEGWCGKQHACYVLSKLAKFELLTFIDADVRLEPEALARMVAFLQESKAGLVSGFPRQETGTFLEKLLIPLIHWTLLCFLPLSRMRKDIRPSLGAGCGQWFLTTREAYEQAGGHEAIKASLHDGVKLPRAYRKAGIMTDICDVTELATCRMYRTNSQVWFGLAKNAREGLGDSKLLPFFTMLFIMGQVIPTTLSYVFFIDSIANGPSLLFTSFFLSHMIVSFVMANISKRFGYPHLIVYLHPLAILVLLAIQWYANIAFWLGRPVGWKGRAHPSQMH